MDLSGPALRDYRLPWLVLLKVTSDGSGGSTSYLAPAN